MGVQSPVCVGVVIMVGDSIGMGVQSPVCVGVVIMVGDCWHGCPISGMCGCGHHGWCLLAWVSNLLYVWVWSSWLVSVGMRVQAPVCVGVVIMVGISVGMGVQTPICVGVVIMVGVTVCWYWCPSSCMCGCGRVAYPSIFVGISTEISQL